LGDVIQDRQQMSLIQKELNELTRRYEERSGALREKEQILRDYEKMINDSENAYKKVTTLRIFFLIISFSLLKIPQSFCMLLKVKALCFKIRLEVRIKLALNLNHFLSCHLFVIFINTKYLPFMFFPLIII